MICLQSGSKKEAEALVKNIIKIVIKIGILYRNGQFDTEESMGVINFKKKFRSVAMAMISFYEVDFSYDRTYLLSAMHELHASLKHLVLRHLTEKSLLRIDYVFNFFSEPTFLDTVFKRNSEYSTMLSRFVEDLNRALDEGGM